MSTRTLIILLLIAMNSSCEKPQHRELQGFLYFPAGSYLGRFDVSDASSSAAANLGNVSIGHLSAIDSHRLLVSMRGTNNSQAFSRVVQIDTRTNQVVDLFSGTAAWFIPDGKFYVFDDGEQIIARGRRAGDVTDIIVAEHRRNHRIPVTLLDGGDLLYELSTNGQSEIRLFNVRDGNDFALDALSDICVLDGSVWISSKESLLCRQIGSGPAEPEYVIVSIDGEGTTGLNLPDARSLRAVAYLEGQDAVIFTAIEPGIIGGSPTNHVWFHDLRDGQSYQLSADQYLGDAVAWGGR